MLGFSTVNEESDEVQTRRKNILNAIKDFSKYIPIHGKESHTVNLENFDACIEPMKAFKRNPLDNPFCEKFWNKVREILVGCSPLHFDETPLEKSNIEKVTPALAAETMKLTAGTFYIEKFVAMGKSEFMDIIEPYLYNPDDGSLHKNMNVFLTPMHPVLMTFVTELDLDTIITELLYASQVDLTVMKWSPVCERCASITCARANIAQIPDVTYCPGCRYKNTTDCLEKVQVFFEFNHSVFYVMFENYQCAPSTASVESTELLTMIPASYQRRGFQVNIGCGKEKLRPCLPKGNYRVHCPVTKTDLRLVIQRDAKDNDQPISCTYKVSDYQVSGTDPLKTIFLKHGKVIFNVFTDTMSFSALWTQRDGNDDDLFTLPIAERPPFTSAKEILAHPTFRDFYEDDIGSLIAGVTSEMKLEVGGEAKDEKPDSNQDWLKCLSDGIMNGWPSTR